MRFFLVCVFLNSMASAQPNEPLRLVATIPLPNVEGRIDHLAIDAQGQRLFVAALGNNTLEVIDIRNAKRLHSISGLREPQGIAYVPRTNRIYVANRADGTLHIIDGGSYETINRINYRDNADNVRYDPRDDQIWVGYGGGPLGLRGGALAVIDAKGATLSEIAVDAHPESFQLETSGPRIFVNLPRSHKIGVVDRATRKVVGAWKTGGAESNFPMALDQADRRLMVVCRSPARLVVLDTSTGQIVTTQPAVADSDDLFYDSARKRIYAIGGEGSVWVYQQKDPDHYVVTAKVATVKGARTGFFSPALDRLFVAVRREGSQNAEIRTFSVQ
jgi:DNA-binding beta-propeller fold protein YncE